MSQPAVTDAADMEYNDTISMVANGDVVQCLFHIHEKVTHERHELPHF